MYAITQCSPTAQQMSGLDPEGREILSVLAKRTYQLEMSGRCVLAEEQLPLVTEPVADPDVPDLLAQDMDIYPFKPATDVVLRGHVWPSSGCRSLEAAVQVGSAKKALLAIGDRKCYLSATGRIVFSEPAPLRPIPLSYRLAYGGKDAVTEARQDDPFEGLRQHIPDTVDLSQASPYAYPRNPCGVGYLVEASAEAVDQLKLPNLEDPADRLSSERLVVGKVQRWSLMPLPQALDWVHHFWFPRLALFGYYPEHELSDNKPIAEVARGFIPSEVMLRTRESEKHLMRFTNGASLGLQLPFLKGDEQCLLTNIHPMKPRFGFRLPGGRPKIWTDGRNGKLSSTEPVIHTVLIEVEEQRLSIVWRGSAPALRRYFPEELEKMPFRVAW
jgi:hypothetical protein